MTRWRAIVPVNLGRAGKTRLAERLSEDGRRALMLAMAEHVVGVLARVEAIAAITLLSPEPPPLSGVEWRGDRGRGLNAEIAAALLPVPTLVLLGDLPLVTTGEVRALLSAAHGGAALAPDRAGSGTNALALIAPFGFVPAFGDASLARHRALLPDAATVDLPGLALDVDTPDDLDRALAAGFIAAGI